jgi:hypothetical protein
MLEYQDRHNLVSEDGRVIFVPANNYERAIIYDAKWGNGRGEWFDENGRIIKFTVWREADSDLERKIVDVFLVDHTLRRAGEKK